MMKRSKTLKQKDYDILAELVKDGRITYTELARKVGMSPAGVLKKVRSLEEEKIILGYTAILNHEKLGKKLKLLIFVKCSAGKHSIVARQIKKVAADSILEIHEITGDYDVVVKAVVRDRNEAKDLIAQVSSIPHVVSTSTSMVLDTVLERPSIAPS